MVTRYSNLMEYLGPHWGNKQIRESAKVFYNSGLQVNANEAFALEHRQGIDTSVLKVLRAARTSRYRGKWSEIWDILYPQRVPADPFHERIAQAAWDVYDTIAFDSILDTRIEIDGKAYGSYLLARRQKDGVLNPKVYEFALAARYKWASYEETLVPFRLELPGIPSVDRGALRN